MYNNDDKYRAGIIVGMAVMIYMAFWILLTKPFLVKAQDRSDHEEQSSQQHNVLDSPEVMTNVLLQTLTIWRNPNTLQPIFAQYCRRYRFGCENTMAEYSSYFFDKGNQYNIDPWMLASIAKNESNYNAFAVGGAGEKGIMQLLPRSPVSNGVRFVHQPAYRRACKAIRGHCQEEVVNAAAYALQRSTEHCGSFNEALTRYNTGQCHRRGNTYTRNVLRTYRYLTRLARTEAQREHS